MYVLLITWDLSATGKNLDSSVDLFALVHKHSHIALFVDLVKVHGSAVLFQAHVGATNVASKHDG